MWPPLLMLHPDLARSALKYRFQRRHAAADLAHHFGQVGLRYPWESALTGVEAETGSYGGLHRGDHLGGCSVFEIHIGGDICSAFYLYNSAVQNRTWLISEGAEVIRGIASFYASRVVRQVKTTLMEEGYGILNAMGPDEFHPNVNNSGLCTATPVERAECSTFGMSILQLNHMAIFVTCAIGYVNAIAALSIRSAIDISASLGLPVPANWSEIVDGLHIPFDSERQYHPEYDTYSGQIVKQADTIMLGFPLSSWVNSFGDLPALKFNHTVHTNDLVHYADHTTESGPAMTWAM